MTQEIPSVADVVVVGGGQNGLVCAFYLAKQGKDVVVLEQRADVGGACVTEELIPGARFSTCANCLWQLQPRVEGDMELGRHGLRYDPYEGRIALLPDGQRIVYSANPEETAAEIGRLNAHDGRRFGEWVEFWTRAASLIHPYFLRSAPTIDELRVQAQRTGVGEVLEALLTNSTRQLCDRFFEDERVKGALIYGEDPGPDAELSPLIEAWSYASMFTSMGASGGAYVRGGMGSVTQAMRRAAEEAGAVVVTDAGVRAIRRDDDGSVEGVELEDGSRIDTRAAVSNADPKRTFGQLLSESSRPEVEEWSTTVGFQKFHAIVSELPDLREYFDGEQPTARDSAYLRIVPTLDGWRQALDSAKAGELPEVPIVGSLFFPSVFDPSLAPEGSHTVSAFVSYAPTRLAQGTWETAREEAARRLISRIGEFIPNFVDSLVDWKLLLPGDIEGRNSMTDGNIRHLDMVAGQFLADRPRPGWGHRTPVAGLYLCGAGTHPGGEVTGANGFNAARSVIEDEIAASNQVLS